MESVGRTCLVIVALMALSADAGAADLGLSDVSPDSGGRFGYGRDMSPIRSHDGIRRPYRPVAGGSGYVGSAYGLGKPAVTGLGSRPDWGRSFVD